MLEGEEFRDAGLEGGGLAGDEGAGPGGYGDVVLVLVFEGVSS